MIRKLLVVVLILTIFVPFAYAGYKSNVYQTWTNVTTSDTTITFPYNSRTLLIQNGASLVTVCVALGGGSLEGSCASPTAFQIGTSSELYFTDFVTDAVTMRAMPNGVNTSASPVSVIVTY